MVKCIKMKKLKISIYISLVLILCIGIFIWVIGCNKYNEEKKQEYYIAIADYIFYLLDVEGIDKSYLTERSFLTLCEDEYLCEILREEVDILHINICGDNVVVIRDDSGFVNFRGYAIVRNGVTVPNEDTREKFQSAEYEKITDRLYSFKWFNMLE